MSPLENSHLQWAEVVWEAWKVVEKLIEKTAIWFQKIAPWDKGIILEQAWMGNMGHLLEPNVSIQLTQGHTSGDWKDGTRLPHDPKLHAANDDRFQQAA